MSEPASAIRSIVIVGGGTAGWSAAACLARFLAKRGTAVTLVESSAIGTVGVGEASVPNIQNFNRYVGLSERDFISGANGTFKLGIRFDDWARHGSSFFHPFGGYGLPFEDVEFHHCLNRARELGDRLDLADYSLPVAMARSARFSQPSPDNRSPLGDFGYAYHFDAGLYAQQLARIAKSAGVRQIDARICSVSRRPSDGWIEALELENGTRLAADLFVDCSGFNALLIGKALETPYEDWSRWLPCDRAVAIPSAPTTGELPPYTVARALEAGWSWRIPLQHRIGNGYVYSSRHIDAEAATERLLASLPSPPLGEPNHLRFQVGMRPSFWTANCVALGLAGGFIEPLESTSINLVHRGLSTLMDFYPQHAFDPRQIAAANRRFRAEQENIRDFIILHYWASSRNDTAFWRQFRDMSLPQSLSDRIDSYLACGYLDPRFADSFKAESWLTMFEAFGLRPAQSDSRVLDIDMDAVRRALPQIKAAIATGAAQAPLHAEFMARNFSREAAPPNKSLQEA